MPDISSMLSDPGFGAVILPLLAVIVGLIFIKKLMRLVVFAVIVGGIFFVLESQGIYVMDHFQAALNDIPLGDMTDWLISGNR